MDYLLECRGIVGAISSDSNNLSPSGYVWVNYSFHLQINFVYVCIFVRLYVICMKGWNVFVFELLLKFEYS